MNMISRKTAFVLLCIVAVTIMGLTLSVPNVSAQTDSSPVPAAGTGSTATPTPTKKLTLWELIRVGGPIMIPIGLMSMAALALVVRNFVVLQEKKLLRPDIVPTIQQHMAMRDVYEIQNICLANPCLLTAVLSAGLERVTSDQIDLEAIEQAMEEASTEQMTAYLVPINYLSIIGVVAPMLGLLGTVSGMIKAFYKLAEGGMGRPELLAGDIGEALVTTAAGLIVAIPSMILYFYFKHNFIRTMATLGRLSGNMMDALRTGQLPGTFTQQQEETENT